jgi:hypothetical protein
VKHSQLVVQLGCTGQEIHTVHILDGYMSWKTSIWKTNPMHVECEEPMRRQEHKTMSDVRFWDQEVLLII